MLFYLLFIAGFIALLLFISTKIRNAANAAYEPEKIERGDFQIFKPEGYLNPVEWTETVPFEAYTRELGERTMGRLRKSAAKMMVSDGLNFDNLRKEIKANAEEFVSTVFDANAPEGGRICLIETKKTDNEITTVFFNKLIESRKLKKTFDIEISILEPYRDEFEERINQMLDSFKLN
ncbi:MAG: hypothetical protein ABIP06_09880 [Pyrinomonadaceae bacterium]